MSIPNIYHFVFGFKTQTEEFHLIYNLCIRSCVEINKPDKIYFHYRNLPYGPLWDEIQPFITLNKIEATFFVDTFAYSSKDIEPLRYAHLADIVRLEVLKQYGGIYADIDTIFVNPLPDYFFQQRCIMGKERADFQKIAAVKAGGSLCNAWIASEQEAAFCKLWLNHLSDEFDGTWSAHSTFLPYRLSQEHPELIGIEPERSFYHFDWTETGIKRIFNELDTDLKGVYSIHLWNHVWWNPEINNYRRITNQKISRLYILYGNTTYGFIASRYFRPDTLWIIGKTRFLIEKYSFYLKTFLRNLR